MIEGGVYVLIRVWRALWRACIHGVPFPHVVVHYAVRNMHIYPACVHGYSIRRAADWSRSIVVAWDPPEIRIKRGECIASCLERGDTDLSYDSSHTIPYHTIPYDNLCLQSWSFSNGWPRKSPAAVSTPSLGQSPVADPHAVGGLFGGSGSDSSSSTKDAPPPSAKPVFSATAFSSASTAPPGDSDDTGNSVVKFKPAPGSAGTPAQPGSSVYKTASNSFNNLDVRDGSNVGLMELALMLTNIGDMVTNIYNSVTNIANFLSPESKKTLPQSGGATEPTTPEELVNVTNIYILDADLDMFYRSDDPFLRQLAEKASARIGNPAIALNTSQDAVDLTKLALYNNVILCGLLPLPPLPSLHTTSADTHSPH